MSRVILSMTTIPARDGLRGETLDSILAQTRKPDSLCVFGGGHMWTCNEFMPYAEKFGMASLLEPGLSMHLAEDRGPVTKLAVLEESWLRDDDIIITIDDDIIYEPTWLETLVAAAEAHPTEAVGFSGWNTYEFIRAWKENDPAGGGYVWPNNPGPCDVLEGWAGVAYRKKFFDVDPVTNVATVLHPLPMFRNVDDVWISWHLHRRGVGRRLIGKAPAKERPDNLPGLHNRPDFVDLNRQAAIVAFGGVE